MDLSIIIPYHNEGIQFITETLDSIKATVVVDAQIIAVDDFSSKPLPDIDGVEIVRHTANMGVGAAFDSGVARAKSDNLFLMGSDIRFLPNKWASKMIAEVEKNPKSFISTACIGINTSNLPDSMDMEKRKSRTQRLGAEILFFHDHLTNRKMPPNFRDIFQAKWLPVRRDGRKESFEVPCILGAAYGVSKSWYEHCDGWWGHRSWGGLEPYISLKSWLFGGSCLVAPSISTGHIFKRGGTHGTPLHHIAHNKMLIAHLLMADYDRDRMIAFMGEDGAKEGGQGMIADHIEEITAKRAEYKSKIVVDVRDLVKRFGVDFRE